MMLRHSQQNGLNPAWIIRMCSNPDSDHFAEGLRKKAAAGRSLRPLGIIT
jgi:hypothetical protein